MVIKNARVLVGGRIVRGADVLIEGGRIGAVGRA
jgi:dihydroorotase-like cyclic amidohydrolase